jgi:ribosomal protein L12E/L44/L45/RPP1/RPP2
MGQIGEERVYLEMFLKSSTEEDENGNPLIMVEASNENLDQQEQKVLQRALLDSKEYFMRNGIISYDHRHLRRDPSDPSWNPEKYIIGEPVSVESKGNKTFVKARLFRSSPIVKEILTKLKDGARYLKASVGGIRPVIENVYDEKLKRPLEQVISVLWNELAITPKPVNDTLSPVALSSASFVKSLTMGYTTDPSSASGGAALGVQSLEGVHRRRKEAIHLLLTGIAVGDITTPSASMELLAENGVTDSKEASDILEEIVNRRKKIQEVFRMDAKLCKALDETIAELEKAMDNGDMPPVPVPAPAPKRRPRPDVELPEEEEDEDEEVEYDDDGGEGDTEYRTPPRTVEKSGAADGMEFLDVSPIIAEFAKSLSGVKKENIRLSKLIKKQDALLKSIGGVQIQTAQLMKSLAGSPVMRKSVLSRNPRFVDADRSGEGMSREEILRKSTLAVKQGKMEMRKASVIEDRLNKGIGIDDDTISFLKSVE